MKTHSKEIDWIKHKWMFQLWRVEFSQGLEPSTIMQCANLITHRSAFLQHDSWPQPVRPTWEQDSPSVDRGGTQRSAQSEFIWCGSQGPNPSVKRHHHVSNRELTSVQYEYMLTRKSAFLRTSSVVTSNSCLLKVLRIPGFVRSRSYRAKIIHGKEKEWTRVFTI